jgi:predicted RNA binding protein YcfA (HicA-like mRNA interferase family)
MGKQAKVFQKIVSARQDNSIQFSEVVGLLAHLGFTERIKGGHHIFTKVGIVEIINLQPKGAAAKAYQVGQIRGLINKYHLEVKDE